MLSQIHILSEIWPNDFEKYLKEIDGTVFEKNNAVTLCEKYQGIYEPLYRQFFARYFGSSKAEKYKKEAK